MDLFIFGNIEICFFYTKTKPCRRFSDLKKRRSGLLRSVSKIIQNSLLLISMLDFRLSLLFRGLDRLLDISVVPMKSYVLVNYSNVIPKESTKSFSIVLS